MFGFRIRTRQNGTDSPRKVDSPAGAGTPVGEVDTRAPFQSVKAAVSLFGVGSPKATITPVVKKPKTAEERVVLEKESQLHLTLKQLEKCKEQLKYAESTKSQALRELEKANRTLQELTNKIETVSNSKQDAIAATEAAKDRAKQLEEVKSSQPELVDGGRKQDVESEREQYKASAAELAAAKQELTSIRQDFDASLEVKLNAFQQAADAQHAAKVNRERLSELTKEITKRRETAGQVKFTSQQAQEEQTKIMAEKEARLQSLRNAKEEVEKKIRALKEEYDLEFAGNLEEKLEETTEAIKVLQEQLENVRSLDLESMQTATSELDDAKKALQEVSEEESSFRSLVESLKLELDNVQRDYSELKETEDKTETLAQNLQTELDKSKAELEAARARETKQGDASDDMHQSLQQLSSETENARRGAEEMKRQAEELKQEAETARIEAKEAEEKLQVTLKEAEEAKAAEKLAGDQIHSSPAEANANANANANGSTNSEFNNKIKLSVEEFESLSRKAEQFENMAEKEEAAALAQVKAINESENEAAERLEARMQELENIKAATGDALKKAEMADAAKRAVENELRKWRQKEQENAETKM